MKNLWTVISHVRIPVETITTETRLTSPIAYMSFSNPLVGDSPYEIQMEDPLYVFSAWEFDEDDNDKCLQLRYRIHGPEGHPLHSSEIDYGVNNPPYTPIQVFEFELNSWYYDFDGVCQLSIKWEDWEKVTSLGRFAFLIRHIPEGSEE